MNKKPKKTYLPTVCVSIIYITLIACIINDCRQVTQDHVDNNKLHIEKISNLEDDPITLAKEFMQTEYDKHWNSLKGCHGRYDEWRMENDYELSTYIVPERYPTVFTRYNRIRRNGSIRNVVPADQDLLIMCNAYANDESEYVKSVVIAFYYSNSIHSITVYIDYHGDNPAEPVNFNIDLTENGYVADRINAEELTGLTIEEMVETAELNRKGFEDLMYTMKEHELEESKKDLNSDLKSSYTIAALQIVALLSLWITVLVAIIKSESGKKQILFHSRSDRGTKHEGKQKT